MHLLHYNFCYFFFRPMSVLARIAGAAAAGLFAKEYFEHAISHHGAWDQRTMSWAAVLSAVWAAWVCYSCRGRLIGAGACFLWVTTWLVTPFLVTFLLAFEVGILWALALWLFVGVLAPTVPQSNGFRAFIRNMSAWVDEHKIVGEFAQPKGSKPVMYCHHPHGHVAILSCASGSEVDCAGVAAPPIFKMPFCKQMMNLMGSISSAPAPFKEALRSGRNVAILPGGVEEVVLSSSDVERAYIQNRKGFVKYAIQFGYDLVPVYHFGETQLYSLLWPFDVPWVVKLRLAIAQKFQIATGVGVGYRHLPLVPNPRARCRTVVGARVVLPHQPEVEREAVVKWHAEYVMKLQKLFDGHKRELPAYAKKELELW